MELTTAASNWVGEDEDDEEEGEEDSVLAAQHLLAVDPVRMGSIGCTDDERWKRFLWSQMPRPEESDSDGEDGDEDHGDDPFSADVEETGAREVLSFARVVGDMVSTGISEGHPAGSLLMEIKGYKFAQNKVRLSFTISLFAFIFLSMCAFVFLCECRVLRIASVALYQRWWASWPRRAPMQSRAPSSPRSSSAS